MGEKRVFKTMTSLLNRQSVLCNQHFPFACVAVRHYKKKKWEDPYLYKYDRWGRVKERLGYPGGRKNTPFDRRFPINPRDVGKDKLGGSVKLSRLVGRDKSRFPHPPGYIDEHGRFHLVKEMIPEFVVPDLTKFKLKPYVSYNVDEVKQSTFSAEELFYSTYGKTIGDLYMNGKIKDLDKFKKNFEEDESTETKLESKMSKLALKSK